MPQAILLTTINQNASKHQIAIRTNSNTTIDVILSALLEPIHLIDYVIDHAEKEHSYIMNFVIQLVQQISVQLRPVSQNAPQESHAHQLRIDHL